MSRFDCAAILNLLVLVREFWFSLKALEWFTLPSLGRKSPSIGFLSVKETAFYLFCPLRKFLRAVGLTEAVGLIYHLDILLRKL